MNARRSVRQEGQVMVLVAVALLALIGSAALMLLGGSVEWQKNQLQELADNAALDASLQIGIGCTAAQSTAVIREADNFLATRRPRTGALGIVAGTCATPYRGTDTFAGPITATINYPYRAHQQQVEVILSLTMPISFGAVEGIRNTTVTRRAVAQAPAASIAALTATTITCQPNAQMNVQGSVVARNLITVNANCAIYAHGRRVAGAWSDFGNVTVSTDGQVWARGGGACAAGGANAGSRRDICADGYELTGTTNPTCATAVTEFLSGGVEVPYNPNPCAAGTGPTSALAPPVGQLTPEPNLDPAAVATLRNAGGGALGAACNPIPAVPYPMIRVGGVTVGTGLGPVPLADAAGFYHFRPSCYGYLDVSLLPSPGGGRPARRATFDPGFYYFNGSRAAGNGGGVCLGGTGQVVGRDITLEFVRNSVFNTGNCMGGAAGAGAFGARPCSSRPCPPNAPPDGLTNTWLAGPCSTPPSAADVSCRGAASWCPAGDRSCWNQLIWASAAVSGRFQVTAPATAWLLGTISWPGACFWGPNSLSAIDGAVSCGTFQFTTNTSNQATIGTDYGINTALSEALLVE